MRLPAQDGGYRSILQQADGDRARRAATLAGPGCQDLALVWRQREIQAASSGQAGDEVSPTVSLTPRELEVLTLVSQGLTYKEVGAELHLSERTIKYHMGEIIARLHLENRAQVIAYARRSGLLK